ncbi:MAG TPA: hypothetical protein VI248_20895 [Kineosporiaceae bacterium]
MRYLVLLRGIRMFEAPPALMEGLIQLGEEATHAGALLETAGLAPSVSGARVRLAGGRLDVIDAPFTESGELLSYAIYQVRTKEEAVQWASRFLRLHQHHAPGWEGNAEILKVFGPEDFPAPAAAGSAEAGPTA